MLPDPGLIEAIACWCDCLAGNRPLLQGLDTLSRSVGAEAVALSRISLKGSGAGRAIASDPNAPANGPLLNRTFAPNVLGNYVTKSREKMLWFSSMSELDGDVALSDFQRRRKLKELVVITLAVDGKSVDFLELHFAERLDAQGLGILNMILGTLCTTWARRAPGLFSEAVLARPANADLPDATQHLLSQVNPARLSRSEYRVCLLLSRGLSSRALRDELGISNSTLRTHLRNVYSKTGASSVAELTYRLVGQSLSNQMHSRQAG
jgi:DNA-binding CsgD family transcriptional regulator